MIVGRKKEKKILRKILNKDSYAFVPVQGKRRIGKTYLIDEFFNDAEVNLKCLYLKFIGYKDLRRKKVSLKNIEKQLMLEIELSKELGEFHQTIKEILQPIESWFDFFNQLALINNILKTNNLLDKNLVIFLDEVSWLHSGKDDFLEAFSTFINQTVTSNKIKVIVAGSSPEWIQKHILETKGALYNRKTEKINLKPFTIQELKEYFAYKKSSYSNYEIIKMFMLFGGVAYYYEQLDLSENFEFNLQHYVFNKNGVFYQEFDLLFDSLFKETKLNYHKNIMEIVVNSKKGILEKEILEKFKEAFKGNIKKENLNDNALKENVRRAIRQLVDYGFLQEKNFYKRVKRERQIYVNDFYCYFYLKYMKGKSSLNHKELISILGYCFELFCFEQIDLIKQELGILNIETQEYFWKNNKAQIDLLLHRADKTVTIIECKFYENDLFVVDSDYVKNLENKKNEFLKEATNVRNVNFAIVSFNGTNKTAPFTYQDIIFKEIF